jgi:hypothetical protein
MRSCSTRNSHPTHPLDMIRPGLELLFGGDKKLYPRSSASVRACETELPFGSDSQNALSSCSRTRARIAQNPTASTAASARAKASRIVRPFSMLHVCPSNALPFSGEGRKRQVDGSTAGDARRPSFITWAARPRLVGRRPRAVGLRPTATACSTTEPPCQACTGPHRREQPGPEAHRRPCRDGVGRRGCIAGAGADQAPAVTLPRKRARDVSRSRDDGPTQGLADRRPGTACAATMVAAE